MDIHIVERQILIAFISNDQFCRQPVLNDSLQKNLNNRIIEESTSKSKPLVAKTFVHNVK